MIRFPFNEEKAAQAAAYLVWRHGGQFDYRLLVKLLYLADRRALLDGGIPITGAAMWSMRQGPVLGQVMDCIKNKGGHGQLWHRFLKEKDGNHVIRLVRPEFETDELSDFEVSILDQIDEEYGGKSEPELMKLVHDLPEYTQTDHRFPILVEKLLAVEHVPRERIAEIQSLAEEIAIAKRAGAAGP